MSEESDQKKAEEINVAKYKIIVWSDGCFARFRSRFVFHLLTKNFFWFRAHVELQQKSHGKGLMDGVGRTVKNIIFCKVKSGFVTIDSPFQFHQTILKFVLSVKSVYVPDADVLNEPENIEQLSKKILETLKLHHVERFEVKGVLKFFS